MAKSGKKKPAAPVTDPFQDVDAKSITEIELDQRVDLQREDLPAAAKLTDLPMKWVLLVLIVCIGASELAQRVESKQLIQAARDSGLMKPEEAERADEVDELVKDRERVQDRIRELQDKRDQFDKLSGEEKADAEEAPEIPLTMESLRAEIRRLAGDRYEDYRKFATLIALLIGGFGLILLAVFVRALAAALIGGIAGGVVFFLQLDPWIMYAAAGAGALIGAGLAPRLLLANMLFNVTLAGMMLGGVLFGGGVFMVTGNELYSIFGLGIGLVMGALIGFKFARQLFLSAVLANAAGFSTLVLWLAWGDLYAHFWPITFGGLMILDAVATRIYHRVRWAGA